jgi:SpoVK/Ycf46/Vps4 family AAA+-type ATPase
MQSISRPSVHQAPAALSPTQRIAFTRLVETIAAAPMSLLLGGAGVGKSTLIAQAAATLGGLRVSARALMEAPQTPGHPAYEESLHRLISDAMQHTDRLFVEDFDLVCYTNKMAAAYPRPYYLQVALQAWLESAIALGKQVVFTATSREALLPQLEARYLTVEIGALTAADYRFFLEHGLGTERARALDVSRIFSAAPRLSVYQLLSACVLAREDAALDAAAFLDILSTRVMSSNVSLGEVARVDFADLKGCDDLIDNLETHIVTPMRDAARFSDLGLTPKRGVLLFGPPGTGKTSVGRALAHRLKGKFFMIDGTFTSEPPADFYARVKRVFERAKHNTPSVIFIDDADVLMQSDRLYGLNRYLLTMLDGLESETNSMVTVMLTAMDPAQLPAALLRSGRIELWLETTLPDASARAQILREHLGPLGPSFGDYDAETIAERSDGFTGADLKRVIADVKALYARDVVRGNDRRTTQAYLESAVAGIRANKAILTRHTAPQSSRNVGH